MKLYFFIHSRLTGCEKCIFASILNISKMQLSYNIQTVPLENTVRLNGRGYPKTNPKSSLKDVTFHSRNAYNTMLG